MNRRYGLSPNDNGISFVIEEKPSGDPDQDTANPNVAAPKPTIPMMPVKSANLSGVGYDPETTTLTVSFNRGATYTYQGVPEKLFEAMMSAASPGKFFYSAIRDDYGHAPLSKGKK